VAKGVFITGTDTGIGKTRFTLALMEGLKKQGKIVSGMKPVACGARRDGGVLLNEDAEIIMRHASRPHNYEDINPIVFEPPIAPHIAANMDKEDIDIDKIVAAYRRLESDSDLVVVEGVGGWRVPLSDLASIVDMVRALDLSVIMVVGLRLGCINHAILTAEAIQSDGMNLMAWVSNQVEKDYLNRKETIGALNKRLSCPHIADIAYLNDFDPDKLHENIDISCFEF